MRLIPGHMTAGFHLIGWSSEQMRGQISDLVDLCEVLRVRRAGPELASFWETFQTFVKVRHSKVEGQRSVEPEDGPTEGFI